MDLDKLKKKLYKPESEFEERLEAPEAFQPEIKRHKPVFREWKKIEKKGLSMQQKKYLKWGSILIVGVFLILAGFLFWHGLTSFDKDEVKLEISGPERVVSGEEVQYIVTYQNKSRLNLEDLRLVFYYPENSIPLQNQDLIQTIDLTDLGAGQKKELEFLVRIIGLKDEEKQAKAELSYQPEGISSRFTSQADFSSQIISVPLILDFDLPEIVVNDKSFDFSLRYLNQAEVPFDNLRVQVEYPSGFTFESAEPLAIEEDRIWSLGQVMVGEEGKIFIRGKVQGTEGEAKPFKAQLGVVKNEEFIPYAETADASSVSASLLSVSQTINNSDQYIAQAGEELNYVIDYKNTTQIGIRNVVITAKLEGQALDLESLELEGASFDGVSQTITWNASNLSDLEYLGPQEQGQVSFSVKIKEPLPVNSFSDKNFSVKNTVKIDSSQKPISLEGIEISGQSQSITKITSQLSLSAQGFFNDDLISNIGPIPPKVGQTTTYTIKWRLVNSGNDLSNLKVEAYLPPHVQWKSRINPSGVDLKYSAQTGKVTWQVGNLAAGTGVVSPVKQAAFQISITPSVANLGNLVELIGQSKVTAQDNFTNSILTDTDNSIDTDLPDDLTISHSQGIVIE